MGLDMSLNAKRYLWSRSDETKVISTEIQKIAGIPEDFEVQEITVRVGYWRKANQIHRWFVENVQSGKDDCGHYFVSQQDLIDLRDLCKRVSEDKNLAATELPTSSGFFFGNTEYDNWYYQDLADTIAIIDKALTLDPAQWDFEYHSSW